MASIADSPVSQFRPLTAFSLRAAYQLLRAVPGTLDLRRDLRDAAWLSEADATLVSFPKSGRTYVRAMLARLYQRRFGIDERDLLHFPSLRRAPATVPRLFFTHGGDAMRRPDEIRINPSAYANTKLIFLARHPGDIAISRYHHLRHRSRHKGRRRLAEQPLETFIWTEQGGIPSIVTFMNQFAQIPGTTIVRYPDFAADAEATLARLSRAIGLEFEDEDIADAVAFARLPNLKQHEREGYFRSSRLRLRREGDEFSGKVRKGFDGGHRVELDPEAAARVEQYVSDALDPRFGFSR